ncbi:MAG: nucleotidyltransferase family protein [Oculatellaceae cyanobacterium Prado106]|jgi:hypothetical protein|nr:nucleotidyltransferase family protein [Oculatellaceae cyanobacterium Prado106]
MVSNVDFSRFQSSSEWLAIALPHEAIAQFCKRWKVQEFYLFGSVLRNDFRTDSDIDVMVQFAPDAQWGFEIVDMRQELESIFQRKVDLLTKKSIENSDNWMRRQEILGTARLIYA